MALAPPPLKERLTVGISQTGRAADSLYRKNQPGQDNAGKDEDAWLLIGANLAWSKWLQDLWQFVNNSADVVISITCGADTHSLEDWICGLWDDDQALQAAVLEINVRLHHIICGPFDFDLETWICGFSNALENVTVVICGTPFTQSLTDTFQGIIDNIFFDLGSGCASVIDYITDIYSILAGLGGPFMPIDGSGSGVVPSGQGIYCSGGASAGVFLGPDVVFYDLSGTPTEIGAFLSIGSIGPAPGGGTGILNVVATAFDGGSYASFQLLYDIGTGVIRVY